ncbi:sigma-70 family RNA polymerase sigma factor [Candidatus Clostridium stratigraminis]|uniref:Sigma-70 family RNA polymerase sigma factor n=1 Tax=Candidatus Clostridium stratigraminis TaxID=3381661 RepID=A0ABW8SYA4_9CLOT
MKPDIERLMALYMGSVYGVAKSILIDTGSEQDIEECVQDVFIEAWDNIDKFDESRGSMKTWLLILCKYKALNIKKALLKKNKIVDFEELQLSSNEAIEENLLFKEKKDEIIEAIMSFNSIDKEVFLRRYFMEQSIEYICSYMSLSRQAVDNRLWRGKKKLREILGLMEGRSINE